MSLHKHLPEQEIYYNFYTGFILISVIYCTDQSKLQIIPVNTILCRCRPVHYYSSRVNIQLSFSFYLIFMQRDVHYRKAKSEGYRARSAYKLLEIIEEYNILENVQSVIDLCAAPGSWSQVIKERLPHAHLLSVDLQDIEPINDAIIVKGDITSDKTISEIKNTFGARVDLILCDGAPEVTGLHDLDEYFHSSLITAACSLSRTLLSPSGCFVIKVFTGSDPEILMEDLKEYFLEVLIVKPKSSRIKSKEAFAICHQIRIPE
ncbi:tRNA (cytidine32/guanosine34-2'-O)-methyltransferase [Nematocida parisii]|nr:tRNA (cytidine32/guanosine34-2'-O)-methyltransferase [Nematocida parisii]KAI5129548.1 tRNA (cytidine32/guanosine34-2'-O)-methyltransferase [Nematocida parisii]KAI5144710.1 tRNA (cytidine32/guanosine34-2'-O)-methyltransferase [Nematocida parisii]